MPGAATPQTLLEPIASAAGGGFITNPMPDAPTGTNAASVQGGFPPITMQEELAGGQPPLGQDMNGYLFLISSHTMYVQCGQPYLYNSTLVADIGGYLIGTILGMADGTGCWLNTVNGNSTNPDTGGAGWLAINSSGHATVPGLTTGSVSLTATQWKKTIVYFSGTLTGNVQIVFPTIDSERWLCVNNCTGAHTLTAKTAAGSGVIIPQGGQAQPTGIYCDGTNIQFSTTPLTIPIDQSPNPSTIVERTNVGDVLGRYFNGNTGLENPTVGAVIVQNSAADGFFRKISIANFLLGVLGLTTTFTNPGRIKFFGFEIKWGQLTSSVGAFDTYAYPVPFAHNTLGLVATCYNTTGGAIITKNWTANGFDLNIGGTSPFSYIAVGF